MKLFFPIECIYTGDNIVAVVVGIGKICRCCWLRCYIVSFVSEIVEVHCKYLKIFKLVSLVKFDVFAAAAAASSSSFVVEVIFFFQNIEIMWVERNL